MAGDESKNTVLAIGAHPDDIELCCAGTLALLHEEGWQVVIASMTPGDKGSNRLSPDDISRIRRQEAKESAALLDADYHCLEWRDLAVFYGDMSCKRATALMRYIDPTLVLTHPPDDYLGDHESTSRIVRHACFAAPVRNYEVPGFPERTVPEPTERIPHLYYYDPIEGIDIFGARAPASLIVDITETIDLKERMLAKHESQRAWLSKHHGTEDALKQMRLWAKSRGKQIDKDYGEAFRQHLGHAFPREELLSGALGERVELLD